MSGNQVRKFLWRTVEIGGALAGGLFIYELYNVLWLSGLLS
jgi:hypothetical protein